MAAEVLELHPETPQARFIKKAVQVFQKGGIVVYPTDSGYSIGCDPSSAKALEKLYKIKKEKKYVMALMLGDLKNISEYTTMGNSSFRFIKERIPGPFTFILKAQNHIARKLKVKRWEIGVRVSDHPVMKALFEEMQTPILNTAARINEDDDYTHPVDLEDAFGGCVDLILTCGEIQHQPTNVINLTEDYPEVIRGEV